MYETNLPPISGSCVRIGRVFWAVAEPVDEVGDASGVYGPRKRLRDHVRHARWRVRVLHQHERRVPGERDGDGGEPNQSDEMDLVESGEHEWMADRRKHGWISAGRHMDRESGDA